MRKTIITIVLFFSTILSFGQGKIYGLQFSADFQKSFFSNVGFVFYKNDAKQWIGNVWGPSIGFENNYKFKKGEFIIAPKIGFDYFFYMAIFQSGIHLIDYINSGTHDVRLSPEIGLSLIAMLNFSYSYQISLSNDKLPDISNNKVSIKFNLIGMFNGKLGKLKFKKE